MSATAQELVRAAKGLRQSRRRIDRHASGACLFPFAEDFRERFIREGHLSFDGLLVRARNLVRDQARVRADLKATLPHYSRSTNFRTRIRFNMRFSSIWRNKPVRQRRTGVKLESFRENICGRRSEAVDLRFSPRGHRSLPRSRRKIIKAQDGIECRLTTNFRSNAAILDGVNGAFRKPHPSSRRRATALHRHPSGARSNHRAERHSQALGAKDCRGPRQSMPKPRAIWKVKAWRAG